MEFRIIKGNKIREQRGIRSLREIACQSWLIATNPKNAFTYSALRQWERGEFRPGDDKVPVLLAALGCKFDDISEPVSAVSAR